MQYNIIVTFNDSLGVSCSQKYCSVFKYHTDKLGDACLQDECDLIERAKCMSNNCKCISFYHSENNICVQSLRRDLIIILYIYIYIYIYILYLYI